MWSGAGSDSGQRGWRRGDRCDLLMYILFHNMYISTEKGKKLWELRLCGTSTCSWIRES